MPVIGFLNTGSPDLLPHHLSVFRQALSETGFVEGRNAVVEYRWARGRYDRLPTLAAELVDRNVSIIVANGPAVPVAKLATNTIPIVFVTGVDPVRTGLVASLSHPGGNLTGVTTLDVQLGPKLLGSAASGHAEHSAGGGAGESVRIRRDRPSNGSALGGQQPRTCARHPECSQ